MNKISEISIQSQKTENLVKFNANDDLPKSLFEQKEPHFQAIFDSILSERASKRLSTHKVKNRAEVSGTGKKPWKQKSTGKARAGSKRSPIFVGGGRAFGPTTQRNYNLKVNKKVKKLAFISALSQLAQNQQILVNDFSMNKISTKLLVDQLKIFKIDQLRHILIASSDPNLFLSARNLPNVELVKTNSLTVESLIKADLLIISKNEITNLEKRI
ncbi:50S ribosomal protein L4 [Mesomycoplasma hyopneumoniae]|uniref:Large ribosomal subunit protein uL4 n=4 Tax=Mesomycoplasma hyopneumoniae TaxID=2099 RepID=RL4_MESH2|nr:50S ribosomal protein L4 [Mesomycoplasma hyopneumoniae]Q4A8H2.2 RecName: Full=Large ribosomal subunit protein uL4; AltName: Full=50S ribosomal protein L4 [Mesomycoplasma hyopneumoniae 7448]Q4AAE1.2 RecName: Full=Large ribosomal subunit protein uL4; AltName: Full=50S ribosomal protein L4 [Mesomycoplasma hyopneumoniae J]Q601L4.1 RecName: Full=Large ribosomal subunit protein uL4; AltName: Full=50S ribosomal protein L4 [Mesomycoplasma hyopneumoniae 232]AAV27445.1 50s ribosomal protein L4 [Mesomy